jgi:antitoxin (DNA-binding transcriptional repressor) of toxin-antitoxin stability system
MAVADTQEAKTQLETLVTRAEPGGEVVIARDAAPAVRLSPIRDTSTWASRTAGTWRGQVWMSDDFDEPKPELEAAIYGDNQ